MSGAIDNVRSINTNAGSFTGSSPTPQGIADSLSPSNLGSELVLDSGTSTLLTNLASTQSAINSTTLAVLNGARTPINTLL